MGWYPVEQAPYDADYWAKYEGYARTDRGLALNRARLDLVSAYHDGPLVDVGIGCGQFVQSRPGTVGYDVNPVGVRWLKARGLWHDPYKGEIEAASFWDSLEHIPEPAPLLANIRRWVFVSLPIFRDSAHVLRSKHFRKDEHCWYWTRHGLIGWMRAQGFVCRLVDCREQLLGREDIESFVFERC